MSLIVLADQVPWLCVFPLTMTAMVVGCATGFLLGFRAWLTLTMVLSGTYPKQEGGEESDGT